VWAYGRGQTDRHTDTQTRVTTIHFAWSTTHAKCNNPALQCACVMIITRSIISGASSKNVDIADRKASQIASSFNFLSQYSQQLGSSFLCCFSALLMSLLLKPLLHLQYSLRHVSHSTRNFLQISFNAKWQSYIQLINK